MMKVTLRISSLFFGLVLWSATAWAQPANDHCDGAIELQVYGSEAEAVLVSGDTRNTTDGLGDNIPVCSANFYRDDVWYKVTFPSGQVNDIYAFKVYFGDEATDITAVGMAVYNTCDAIPTNTAIYCENQPLDNQGALCHPTANQTFYIRVWSAAGDAANWQTGQGTFRIAVFPKTYISENTSTVLWGNQPGQGDFNGGLNGWTTEGISCNGTPAENAQWTYSLSGFPFYYFGGDLGTLDVINSINSRTACDGSMIFDSGLLNFGPNGNDGVCPWMEHEGALISPVIDLSEFNTNGVSVLFNQDMQRFTGGRHFVDYSIDGGLTWTEIEINADKTALTTGSTDPNDGYYNEEFRVRLPGAQNVSDLRIRFRFKGGAYWWVIDDVRIIETECNNTRISSQWHTGSPWAIVPADQVYPFPVLADVENIGACPQTNVVLTATVTSTGGNVIYNEELAYGNLAPDSLDENRLFPELVNVPPTTASYNGVLTLTQDSTDFQTSDNTKTYSFAVGGSQFALESGATQAISPAAGNWEANAPKSWAYGNFFYPVTDVVADSILWGINNPVEMAGQIINVTLYQWTDANNDDLANFQERKYVGFLEYTVTGNEVPGETFTVKLDNLENEGEPIVLKANFGYLAMIEYAAPDAAAPSLELLGSDERDYRPLIFAFDSVYTEGLVDHKFYSSILAIPADGNLSQVDYGADRFGPTDLVPVVRIVKTLSTSTNHDLPVDNSVTAFPNPASNQVQVKLEFAKPYNDVKLRLIDNLGRVVYYKALEQTITQHVESINLRTVAPGSYLLQVETPDGQRSIPVIVTK